MECIPLIGKESLNIHDLIRYYFLYVVLATSGCERMQCFFSSRSQTKQLLGESQRCVIWHQFASYLISVSSLNSSNKSGESVSARDEPPLFLLYIQQLCTMLEKGLWSSLQKAGCGRVICVKLLKKRFNVWVKTRISFFCFSLLIIRIYQCLWSNKGLCTRLFLATERGPLEACSIARSPFLFFFSDQNVCNASSHF